MSSPGDVVHVVGELPQSAPHSLLPLVAAGQLQTARSATRMGKGQENIFYIDN